MKKSLSIKVVKKDNNTLYLIENTYINYLLLILAICAILSCFKNWLVVGIVLIIAYVFINLSKQMYLGKIFALGTISEVKGSKYSLKNPKSYTLTRGKKNAK